MNKPELKILNRDVMRALIGDDVELARKFEIEFLQQAKVSLKKIVEFFNGGNLLAIKEEAHFLKTSAKAVGAEQTGELLECLENIALDSDKEQYKEKIVLISQTIKKFYGEITHES
jgi:HPt (histidine-containing phosphotransfer) domain-containing protein